LAGGAGSRFGAGSCKLCEPIGTLPVVFGQNEQISGMTAIGGLLSSALMERDITSYAIGQGKKGHLSRIVLIVNSLKFYIGSSSDSPFSSHLKAIVGDDLFGRGVDIVQQTLTYSLTGTPSFDNFTCDSNLVPSGHGGAISPIAVYLRELLSKSDTTWRVSIGNAENPLLNSQPDAIRSILSCASRNFLNTNDSNKTFVVTATTLANNKNLATAPFGRLAVVRGQCICVEPGLIADKNIKEDLLARLWQINPNFFVFSDQGFMRYAERHSTLPPHLKIKQLPNDNYKIQFEHQVQDAISQFGVQEIGCLEMPNDYFSGLKTPSDISQIRDALSNISFKRLKECGITIPDHLKYIELFGVPDAVLMTSFVKDAFGRLAEKAGYLVGYYDTMDRGFRFRSYSRLQDGEFVLLDEVKIGIATVATEIL
jgi:hypothetical protein